MAVRPGTEGRAPAAWTLSEAATLARRTASIRVLPDANAAASTPQKVSPAAVVSTTSTLTPDTRTSSAWRTSTRAPSPPSVTTAAGTRSRSAAGVDPLMTAASCSFTTSRSTDASSSSSSFAAGAAFSTKYRLALAAARTVSNGISNWASTTPACWTAAVAPVESSSSALAEGATMIAFSPFPSTVMIAVPVGALVLETSPRSTPASVKAARSSAPDSSSPSEATKAVDAPARAAATAWLAPLPPSPLVRPVARTVSPGRGIRSTGRMRSTFALPTTTTSLTASTPPASQPRAPRSRSGPLLVLVLGAGPLGPRGLLRGADDDESVAGCEDGDRRVVVGVHLAVTDHRNDPVGQGRRRLADLAAEDSAFGDLQAFTIGEQVLHHLAQVRADRRQSEQPAHRFGGGDDGVGAALPHQRDVVLLADRDHDVRVRVQLPHGQGDQDRRVVPVGGDDDLAGQRDLRLAEHRPAGRVAEEGRDLVMARVRDRLRARVDHHDRLPLDPVAQQGVHRGAALGAVADHHDVILHALPPSRVAQDLPTFVRQDFQRGTDQYHQEGYP